MIVKIIYHLSSWIFIGLAFTIADNKFTADKPFSIALLIGAIFLLVLRIQQQFSRFNPTKLRPVIVILIALAGIPIGILIGTH